MAYSNSRNILPSDVDPAHTYGRANRPSTPIADVIQSAYENDWVDEQMKRREEKERQDKAALEKMRNPDTAASRGHAIARQPQVSATPLPCTPARRAVPRVRSEC